MCARCRVKRPSVDLQLYADVDGSLEALTESLLALNTGRVVFKVTRSTVGPPSAADVLFAQATRSTIAAFGVSVPTPAAAHAASLGVPVIESKCAPLASLCVP